MATVTQTNPNDKLPKLPKTPKTQKLVTSPTANKTKSVPLPPLPTAHRTILGTKPPLPTPPKTLSSSNSSSSSSSLSVSEAPKLQERTVKDLLTLCLSTGKELPKKTSPISETQQALDRTLVSLFNNKGMDVRTSDPKIKGYLESAVGYFEETHGSKPFVDQLQLAKNAVAEIAHQIQHESPLALQYELQSRQYFARYLMERLSDSVMGKQFQPLEVHAKLLEHLEAIYQFATWDARFKLLPATKTAFETTLHNTIPAVIDQYTTALKLISSTAQTLPLFNEGFSKAMQTIANDAVASEGVRIIEEELSKHSPVAPETTVPSSSSSSSSSSTESLYPTISSSSSPSSESDPLEFLHSGAPTSITPSSVTSLPETGDYGQMFDDFPQGTQSTTSTMSSSVTSSSSSSDISDFGSIFANFPQSTQPTANPFDIFTQDTSVPTSAAKSVSKKKKTVQQKKLPESPKPKKTVEKLLKEISIDGKPLPLAISPKNETVEVLDFGKILNYFHNRGADIRTNDPQIQSHMKDAVAAFGKSYASEPFLRKLELAQWAVAEITNQISPVTDDDTSLLPMQYEVTARKYFSVYLLENLKSAVTQDKMSLDQLFAHLHAIYQFVTWDNHFKLLPSTSQAVEAEEAFENCLENSIPAAIASISVPSDCNRALAQADTLFVNVMKNIRSDDAIIDKCVQILTKELSVKIISSLVATNKRLYEQTGELSKDVFPNLAKIMNRLPVHGSEYNPLKAFTYGVFGHDLDNAKQLAIAELSKAQQAAKPNTLFSYITPAFLRSADPVAISTNKLKALEWAEEQVKSEKPLPYPLQPLSTASSFPSTISSMPVNSSSSSSYSSSTISSLPVSSFPFIKDQFDSLDIEDVEPSPKLLTEEDVDQLKNKGLVEEEQEEFKIIMSPTSHPSFTSSSSSSSSSSSTYSSSTPTLSIISPSSTSNMYPTITSTVISTTPSLTITPPISSFSTSSSSSSSSSSSISTTLLSSRPAPTTLSSFRTQRHPQVSYLHLAFPELADKEASQIWKALPTGAKLDAFRHIETLPLSVSDAAKRFPIEHKLWLWLKATHGTQAYQEIHSGIKAMRMASKNEGSSSLSVDRRHAGESLLDFYYNNKRKEGFYNDLMKKVDAYAEEDRPRLFTYLSQQAKASGWTDFAEHRDEVRFGQPNAYLHTIQAIERYLHANKK